MTLRRGAHGFEAIGRRDRATPHPDRPPVLAGRFSEVDPSRPRTCRRPEPGRAASASSAKPILPKTRGSREQVRGATAVLGKTIPPSASQSRKRRRACGWRWRATRRRRRGRATSVREHCLRGAQNPSPCDERRCVIRPVTGPVEQAAQIAATHQVAGVVPSAAAAAATTTSGSESLALTGYRGGDDEARLPGHERSSRLWAEESEHQAHGLFASASARQSFSRHRATDSHRHRLGALARERQPVRFRRLGLLRRAGERRSTGGRREAALTTTRQRGHSEEDWSDD